MAAMKPRGHCTYSSKTKPPGFPGGVMHGAAGCRTNPALPQDAGGGGAGVQRQKDHFASGRKEGGVRQALRQAGGDAHRTRAHELGRLRYDVIRRVPRYVLAKGDS